MTTLVYSEMLALADGSYTTVERRTQVPDGRVIAVNTNFECYDPRECVTVPLGGFWHFDPATEQMGPGLRWRQLEKDELKALGKRGVIRTTAAVVSADPVTGISIEDYEAATGPVPQMAAEEE